MSDTNLLVAKRLLPARWTPLRFHPEQWRFWINQCRFVTVPAGRRSGKTEITKRKAARAALVGTAFPGGARFGLGAPTYAQAKRIWWDDMKALVPKWALAEKPSESELIIHLINDSEIHIIGLDKPERVEGSPWDGFAVTEMANTKDTAWKANIRPALADRKGWAILEGVPEGRNHYYELDQRAIHDTSGEWAAFHWKSAEILDPAEIASARADLDELTFQQEYEASFLNFAGRAYYPFEQRFHCARLSYDSKAPLIFCFDFNIAPGVAVIVQEQRLPNGLDGTAIIGEVYIPRNSNTVAVCDKLISEWGTHVGKVRCYGDATGGAGGSAQLAGSDWDIIQVKLRSHFKDRVRFNVPDSNPRERVRINAVNTRLLNGAKDVHLMVDPKKAPHVVRDLEGVVLLEGGSGELDKDHDKYKDLTHLTDALGYYIAEEFPIESRTAYQARVIGV